MTEGGENGLSIRFQKIQEIFEREIRKKKEQEQRIKEKEENKRVSNFEKNLKKSLKEFQKTYEDNVEKELEKQRKAYFRGQKQRETQNNIISGKQQKSSKYIRSLLR